MYVQYTIIHVCIKMSGYMYVFLSATNIMCIMMLSYRSMYLNKMRYDECTHACTRLCIYVHA